MNATASDLKSAYIHYTRAAAILGEIVPDHPDFGENDGKYLVIQEVTLP